MDNSELLLKEMTEANGVSGYEEEVRKIMSRELAETADKIEYDRIGSVLGTKVGTKNDPRVMVVGHMDEIGFMVKEVTKEGYIKFLALGGWWGHVALGQRRNRSYLGGDWDHEASWKMVSMARSLGDADFSSGLFAT